MRLAITFPLALGVPGGGTQDCLKLAHHLSQRGVKVVLLPVASTGPSGWPRPRAEGSILGRERIAALERDGVEVRVVDPHPVHRMLDGRPVRAAVRKLLEDGPLDALLGWGHEVRFVGSLLARHGVLFASNAAASYAPILASPGRFRGRLRRWSGQTFIATPLRQADLVFVRSEFSKREIASLARVDPERIQVVPCGVDPAFASVERKAPSASEPVTRLLYFGLLVRPKGIFDALMAMGKVAAAGQRDWTLRIAGWGDEEVVRRVAAEAGIGDRIELLGPLDRPGLLEALRWSQLAILPSYTESFGLANAEAQAAGVPVVAYDLAAVPEMIVGGETGWLVATGPGTRPIVGLAAAVEEALADPERTARMGLAGRERVTRLYRWDRSAELMQSALEEALQRRSRRRSSA